MSGLPDGPGEDEEPLFILTPAPAMPDTIVVWDIETCPVAFDAFTEAQQHRYDWELRIRSGNRPDEPRPEASRRVRSFHPFLGWICCISAVSGTIEGGPNEPRTWTAATPDTESLLLERFWEAVTGFRSVRWVTFNGKAFDVPFLTARSIHHNIAPTRTDIIDTYPYRHAPHADLSRLWPQVYGLDDLCAHVGVPSPKQEMTGGDVASAVDEGRMDDIATYGRNEVLATFRCLQASWPLIDS